MTRFFLLPFLLYPLCAFADDETIGPDGKPKFGHSSHGEVFDEGPRQSATLLPGMGHLEFPVTTSDTEAQRFFTQGVAQLHGFWYYEAERSFRQVVKRDPDIAMAYWGLAMANMNNPKRSAEFMKEALKRRATTSTREQAWITAYEPYFASEKKITTEQRRALVKALEKLVFEFPEDMEAKAFLIFQLWDNAQKQIPLGSHTAVDALAQTVLAKQPMHPGVHHYLIHLWNYEDDRRALRSAAVLGQSAPGIAHMWHMPSHTFTRLKRYADAAWQQEASARTDHAHMAVARILPEQIHNYAHNNDWLVENLGFIGRVRDAADLAKNMITLPRLAPGHPLIGRDGYKEERGGFQMGRKRLLDLYLTWGKWEELLALDGSPYMEPDEDPLIDSRRIRAMAIAAFQTANIPKGEEKLAALEHILSRVKAQRNDEADAAGAEKRKSGAQPAQVSAAMADVIQRYGDKVASLERIRDEAKAYHAIAQGKPMLEVKPLLDSARDIPPLRLSRIHHRMGDTKKALEYAEKAAKDGDGQVLPLANLADLQWRTGDRESAKKTFQKLRPLSSQADLGEVAFTRLKPIAEALSLPPDWRPKIEIPSDAGTRPDISTLGPFRWQPYAAPPWEAPDEKGCVHSLSLHKGKPILLVFYLGSGCSHCIEQLNLLSPLGKNFTQAGIEIIAVSSDTAADLNKTFVQAKGAQGFPFPIVADPTLAAFKAYRAFDDFDNQPLHGIFLIDAAGYVRWQDISYQPFDKLEWLLVESKRLLALPIDSSLRTAGK